MNYYNKNQNNDFAFSDPDVNNRHNQTTAGIIFGDGSNISSNAVNTGSVQGKVGNFSGTSNGNSYGNSQQIPNFNGGNANNYENWDDIFKRSNSNNCGTSPFQFGAHIHRADHSRDKINAGTYKINQTFNYNTPEEDLNGIKEGLNFLRERSASLKNSFEFHELSQSNNKNEVLYMMTEIKDAIMMLQKELKEIESIQKKREVNAELHPPRKPSFSYQKLSELLRREKVVIPMIEFKDRARNIKISWKTVFAFISVAMMMFLTSYSMDGKVVSLSKDIKSFQHEVQESFEELKEPTTFGTTPQTTTKTTTTSVITTSEMELTTTQTPTESTTTKDIAICTKGPEYLPFPGDCHKYYICLPTENNGSFEDEIYDCGDWIFDPIGKSCVDPSLPGYENLCLE